MSSREIAELVERRHDNVKRTIDALEMKGIFEFPQIEEIPTATDTLEMKGIIARPQIEEIPTATLNSQHMEAS
jgi:phage regulator Rha-like protein